MFDLLYICHTIYFKLCTMTDALAGADANGTKPCETTLPVPRLCAAAFGFLCSRLSPFLPPAYQITYHHNSTNSNTATVDVLNPSARQYTVTNLKPESVYVFRITAQTRKGWGEAAEALVVTTEKRGNPAQALRPVCLCGKPRGQVWNRSS